MAPRNTVIGLATTVAVFGVILPFREELHGPAAVVVQHALPPRLVVLLAVILACAAIARRANVRRRAPPLSDRHVAVALGLVCGVFAGFWATMAVGVNAPLVLGDELIYRGLAASLSAGEGLDVRGRPTLRYGAGYPALASIPVSLTTDGVAAHRSLQALQALVMASTALPVYLLARITLDRLLSLALATISVAAPLCTLSALWMTEAIQYPVLMWAAYAAVKALANPTALHQIVAIAALAVGTGVRLQTALVVFAYGLSVVGLIVLRDRSRGPARVWLPTLLATCVGAVGWIGFALLTGARPLGAYSSLITVPPLDSVAIWAGRSYGAFALAGGLVAVIVLPGALLTLVRSSRELQALGVFTTTTLIVTLTGVAVLSATPWGLDRVHERNLAPLLPLTLVAAAAGLRRSQRSSALWTAAGAGLVAVGVAVIRRDDFLAEMSVDSPTLLTLDGGFGLSIQAFVALLVLGAVGMAAAIRSPWIIVLTAALTFAGTIPVLESPVSRERAERLAWVDDALTKRARVLAITAGVPTGGCSRNAIDLLSVWTEAANSSVRTTGFIVSENTRDYLDSSRLTVGVDGVLHRGDRPVTARYIVIDSRVEVRGKELARLSAFELGLIDAGEDIAVSLWDVPGRIELTAPLPTIPGCTQD